MIKWFINMTSLVKINQQLISENTKLKQTIDQQQHQLSEHQETISAQQHQLSEHQETISAQQHQLLEHQETISTQTTSTFETSRDNQCSTTSTLRTSRDNQCSTTSTFKHQETIDVLHQQVDHLTQRIMKTDNNNLFRKMLIAIQDLNRLDSLEKEYTKYTKKMRSLRLGRDGECHYVLDKELDSVIDQ